MSRVGKLSLLSLFLLCILNSNAQKDLVISGGNTVSSFVCANRVAYVWGANDAGQLGIGATPNPATLPIQVVIPGPKDVQQVNSGSGAHFVAIDCDGWVWAWGANDDGQVGNGTSGGVVTAPTRVLANAAVDPSHRDGSGYLINAAVVYSGTSNTFAILDNGELVSWGKNDATGGAFCAGCQEGMLGQGTNVSTNTANYVLTSPGTRLTGVIQIFAGDNVAYALVDPDGDGIGTVYSWGDGANGTLGRNAAGNGAGLDDGTQTQSSYARPVHYSDGSEMNNITELQAGDVFGIALDVNNHVWTWGNGGWNNATGNTTVNKTSSWPARVIAGNTTGASNDGQYLLARAIGGGQGYGMAVTIDGKPVAWGGTGTCTDGGMTGTGTTTAGIEPTYIQRGGGVVDDDVTLINRGDTWGFYGTSNNDFYAWGCNNFGQLGIGSTINQTSATAITPPIGCDLRDPPPFVDLSPSNDTTVCSTGFAGITLDAGFTPPTGIGSRYEVRWLRNGTPVKTGDAGTASDLQYIATQDGLYRVEIEYTGTNAGCVVYDIEFEEMTIDYFTQTMSDPGGLEYCGNTATVNVTSSTAAQDPVYTWYDAASGNTVLGTTVGSGSTDIDISGVAGAGSKTVYVEETSQLSGVGIPVGNCDDFDTQFDFLNTSSSNPNAQSRIEVTDYVNLDSLAVTIQTEIYNVGNSVSGTVNFAIYGPQTNGSGDIVADNTQQLHTFSVNVARTRNTGDPQQLNEVIYAQVNYLLAPGTYFISPQNVRLTAASISDGAIKLGKSDCTPTVPIPDNTTSGDILQFTGLSQNFSNNQTGGNLKGGHFYNLNFSKVQGFCDRIPVTLTENCPCSKPTVIDFLPTSPQSYCEGSGSDPINVNVTAAAAQNGNFFFSVDGPGTANDIAPTPIGAAANPSGTIPAITGLATTDGGTYTVRIEDGNAGAASCYTEADFVLNVIATPAAPTGTAPSDFCEGGTAPTWSATAAGGNSLLWYTAATGGTGAASPPAITTTPGTKNVWVSQTTSSPACEGPRLPLTLDVIANPSDPSPTDPTDFCENGTAPSWNATAGAGNQLLWYTAATGGTGSTTAPTINNTPSGTQTVYVSQRTTAAPNCESGRVATSVDVIAAPSDPSPTDPTDFCENGTAPSWNATAGAGNELLWYTAATGGTGSTTTPTINNTPSGTQTVYVSQRTTAAPNCESNRVSTSVDVIAAPSDPSPTDPSDFCDGSTAPTWSATAAGGSELLWYTAATGGTGSTTAPTINNTPAGTQTVYVSQRLSSAPGCESGRVATSVDVIANPSNPSATDPADFCENGTAPSWNASTTAGNELVWYTAATGGTGSTTVPTINNTPSGTQTVYVSQRMTAAPGCESGRTATSVDVIAAPSNPTAPGQTDFCENGTGSWTAPTPGAGNSLLWYTAATGGTGSGTAPTINNTPDGSRSVWVSQVSASPACESQRTELTLTVNPITTITTQPTLADPDLCTGENFTLSVVGAGTGTLSYQWRRGTDAVGTDSPTLIVNGVATTDAGSYTVEVTGDCGSVTSNAIDITVSEPPIVTVDPVDAGGCVGSSTSMNVTATGTAPLTYTWSGPDVSGASNNVLDFNPLDAGDAGIYSVDVSNVCGTVTSATADITITLNETPGVTLASLTDICEGNTVTLQASAQGAGSAPQFTFRDEGGTVIGTANQLTNTAITAALANAGPAVLTKSFTVEMRSNSACITAGAPNPVTSAPVTLDIDPQPETANIVESDQTICLDNIQLTSDAIDAAHTGAWSLSPSNTSSANINTSGLVSGIAQTETAILRYTVQSPLNLCTEVFDEVNILRAGDLTDPSPITAQSTTICSDATAPALTGLTLQAGETDSWSAVAPATITPAGQTGGLVVGENRFAYEIANAASGCNPVVDTVRITIEQEVDASVPGTDATTCAEDYQLAATAVTNGTGTWTSDVAGIVFTPNANDPAAVAGTLVDNTAHTFTWTVSNGTGAVCPDKANDVVITQAGEITSATGVSSQSTTICSSDPAPLLNTTMLDPLTTNESGAWSATAPATITTPAGQTGGLVAGANTFTYTITSTVPGCDPSTGTVTINVIQAPDVTLVTPASPPMLVGTDDTNLEVSTTVAIGSGYSVLWDKVTPSEQGTLTTPTQLTTGLTGLTNQTSPGSQTDIIVCVSDDGSPRICPQACETFTVERVSQTIPQDDSVNVCEGTTAVLDIPDAILGLESESIVTDPTGVAVINTTTRKVDVNTTGLAAGQYDIVYEVFNSVNGSETATLIVVVDEQPTNPALTNITTCVTSLNLAATAPTPATAVGVWSIVSEPGSTANIAVTNDPTAQITGLSAGLTTLEWEVTNGVCPPIAQQMTIDQVGNITPPTISVGGTEITGTTYDMCVGDNVTFVGNVPTAAGETGTWIAGFTGSTGSQPYTATTAGTDVIEWEISSTVPGCNPESKAVTINIADVPQGGDFTIADRCEGATMIFTATGATNADPLLYTWGSTNAADNGSSGLNGTFTVGGATPTYEITLTPENSCGTGTPIIKTANVNFVPSGGTLSPDVTSVCSGDNPALVTFTLSGVTGANTPNPDNNWILGSQSASSGGSTTDNTVSFDMSGTTGLGNYSVSVTPSNACGPGSELTSSVSVIDPLVPTVSLSLNIFCEDTEGLTATASPSVPITGVQYNFYNGGTQVAGPQLGNTHNFAQGDIKDGDQVRVELDMSGATGGCYITPGPGVAVPDASATADGYKIPVLNITSTRTAVCEEETNGIEDFIDISLSVTPETSKGLTRLELLQDGSSEGLTTDNTLPKRLTLPSQSGEYTGEAENPHCPVGEIAAGSGESVIIYEEPEVSFVLSALTGREGVDSLTTVTESKQIIQSSIDKEEDYVLDLTALVTLDPSVNNNLKYAWTVVGTEDLISLDPTASLGIDQELDDSLQITVTNELCEDTETYSLFFFYPLSVPNAFSPNGDGINDQWFIQGLTDFPNAEVLIYNRWGNKVYEEVYSPEKAWDGEGYAVGTYYYIIKLNKSRWEKALTGALTLTR